MPQIHWIVGGIAGGLLGAVIWILVGYFTGYEVGWIAWGVGVLAGAGLRYVAWKSDVEESVAQGVAAAVIAIASIAVAKFAVTALHVADAKNVALAAFEPVTDESMISEIADEIAKKKMDAGEEVKWPPGASLETASSREDYPRDIWKTADTQWSKVSAQERDERKRRRDEERREFFESLPTRFEPRPSRSRSRRGTCCGRF